MNQPCEIVKLRPSPEDVMNTFFEEIKRHGSSKRPAMFIGFNEEGECVLHAMDMSWKELAYVKTCFDMHVSRDWLGLL